MMPGFFNPLIFLCKRSKSEGIFVITGVTKKMNNFLSRAAGPVPVGKSHNIEVLLFNFRGIDERIEMWRIYSMFF